MWYKKTYMTDVVRVLIPMATAFFVGILITPVLTNFMYKRELWKKAPRKDGAPIELDQNGKMNKDAMSTTFQSINNAQAEVKTPRVGGIIIWVSLALTAIFLLFYDAFAPGIQSISFFSKNQTILPLTALFVGAFVGLIDDLLVIRAKDGKYKHGIPRKEMLLIVTLIGVLVGSWFFTKLDISSVLIPFGLGEWNLGYFILPFFVLVFLGTFSSGVIDGIDGLAGGVMSTIFSALGAIAYLQDQIDIASLCAAIVGTLFVFLWFNIPPARFYLGETGMLALTMCLAVVVFLTDTVLILPIIGLPLVVTSLSSFVQIVSKKIWGPEGKVFKVAPLHHHFEAIGWSREKITMRYWVISIVCAVIGVIIARISVVL